METFDMFIQYPRIYGMHKEENDGLLDEEVVVQEKVDGANVSIWLEDGEIKCGSRRKELTEGFRGFVEYAKNHEGINAALKQYPHLRLYGEWLVRHTISYKETAYKEFYLFDCVEQDKFWHQGNVQKLSLEYDIKYPQIFFQGKTTLEEIQQFVGKTNLGETGEGVVIKRVGFVNKFGNHSYGKIVGEKFKETNRIVFSDNNKHSDTYWEMYVVNKYATLARTKKVMNKLQTIIDRRLDKSHTPRIAGTCYNDMLTEEIWDISKKVIFINFRELKRLSTRKFIQIYHDILDDNFSVADTPRD